MRMWLYYGALLMAICPASGTGALAAAEPPGIPGLGLPTKEQPKGEEGKMRFSAADQKQAVAWQEEARTKVRELLKISDLVHADLDGTNGKPRLDFKIEIQKTTKDKDGRFTRYDLEMNSTLTRRIPVVLTVPAGAGRFPAVVCIHGHGGSRNIVYDPASIYRGFALELANRGYVTIATEVGQHTVYEKDRTLVGERLWDLMRCVSYLTTRPEVDAENIGCAGLSLGGEMAMHLGAADTRVKATVDYGGLTTVATLIMYTSAIGVETCWRFPGYVENFDTPDFFCMIAPRWVMSQNGEKEYLDCPAFLPAVARPAFEKAVLPCYRLFGCEERAVLRIHPDRHIFETSSAIPFLDKALRPPTEGEHAGRTGAAPSPHYQKDGSGILTGGD